MSLLSVNTDPQRNKLAQEIFDRQIAGDAGLNREYDERRRKLMYQDILYNLSCLDTAIALNDSRIFTEYAVCLYQLLCNLMKDLDRERIKDQMVMHFQIMIDVLPLIMSAEDAGNACAILKQAILATENEVENLEFSDQFIDGPYGKLRQQYLQAMLRSDTRGAAKVIEEAAAGEIPLGDIYEQILRETMYEVGDLWHRNQITVDKEHYCTSVTQMILSQFYQRIFSQPRKGRTILVCCVGSELHEMGGRMISDLFEYNGWDSIYLGAAVPEQSLLNAVSEYNPDLVGLSVTMPQHLILCHEIVLALKKKYQNLKIAVGGRAFQFTDRIWELWPIDTYTSSAGELIDWADQQFGG
jgi:methanogenic corrinoid protein MtbC1